MKSTKAVPTAVGEEGSLMEAAMDLVLMEAEEGFNKRKKEAAVGEEGPMVEACAKKRKDDPSTDSKAEVEASSKSGVSEAAGEVDDAALSAKFVGLARAENGKWIMPDEDVQFILNLHPDRMPPCNRDYMVQQQNWVRKEYRAHGIVLLDDERAARRAAHMKEMEDELMEMLEGIDMSDVAQWEFTDRYSDFIGSNQEEEGDEVVQPEPIETN